MTRARDTANLIGSGNFSSTTFTATSGQTAFTISHTQGFVQVFMNGLLLDETADYTSNGTAITLTSGAAAGDEIEVVAYNTFNVGDAQTQAQADARYVQTTGHTMTGALTVDDDGATPLTVDRATSDGTIIDVQKDGASVGNIGSVSGRTFVNSQGGALSFKTAGSDRMHIDASYVYPQTDNSYNLGSSGNRFKDIYLSGGIYMQGSTTSVQFDDYEEGTFNLTLAGYYSSPSTTQTVAGYYTKVGNMVHVCCRAEPLNTTGASGHMWLTGLPFASMTPYTVLACTMDHMGTYPNSSPMAYCAGSVAYIDKHVNQGARSAVFHNAVTNGALTITGSYRI